MKNKNHQQYTEKRSASFNSKAITPRVGVASLSSPLEVGAGRAPKVGDDLSKLLQSFGYEVIELGSVDGPEKSVSAGRKAAEEHVHALAFASASWFEDYLVLDLLEECNVPTLLWSLPGMETGALCGTQQLTAYLKQLDAPFGCVYGNFDSPDCRERARDFLTAASLKFKLRRSRIGLAGHRVVGMTEVSACEFSLKKTIGPRIVSLDLPQLLSAANEMPDDEAKKIWKNLTNRSAVCNVPEKDGLDSIKIYAAVKKLVVEHNLDALAVGCYPHLMGRVCLTASLLADEGIPLGCEGDVNGAVGQLILTLLTGTPTHNTDWLEPLEDDTVIFTHCGSGSLSLAENKKDITIAPVRLMDQGCCVMFPSKPGPVTLLSLIPAGGNFQVAMLEGQAVSTEMVFPGNPLRVQFTHPTSEIIDWIHDEGIGHHWMAGYGHVGEKIRWWAKLICKELRLIEV